MKKFIKSLSIALAILLAMTMSFAVFAVDDSSAPEANDSSVADVTTDAPSDDSGVSTESSDDNSDATSNADSSTEDASSTTDSSVAESASESTAEASQSTGNENAAASTEVKSDFPWARVITLIVIVVLIAVLFILAKTKTKLGQKIAKFFKEYWSEIKKVSWYSPKDTMKATGIVLVFLIVAAVAIGLLDFGFTKLIQLLATILN